MPRTPIVFTLLLFTFGTSAFADMNIRCISDQGLMYNFKIGDQLTQHLTYGPGVRRHITSKSVTLEEKTTFKEGPNKLDTGVNVFASSLVQYNTDGPTHKWAYILTTNVANEDTIGGQSNYFSFELYKQDGSFEMTEAMFSVLGGMYNDEFSETHKGKCERVTEDGNKF